MSTGLVILICIVLFAIIVLQLSKVSELAAHIRGEEDVEMQNTNRNAIGLLVFCFVFLVGTVVSALIYKNYMLGYGPHESASVHGLELDSMFNVTLLFTGVVFVLTHIALFWFGYKYRYSPNRRAIFMAHDNKLEIVWTVIPAVVMVFLVIKGLLGWNAIMADVGPNEDIIEIEATGMQFAWLLRYPGADGKLGSKDFRKITSLNPMGQDWSDTKNLDDMQPGEIVLPVGKKVKVRINSRDVLHNFDLPHFRVKMDAVPGIPTFFVFTPTITTEDYRERLSGYSEYQEASDPEDPEGPQLWETFEYELACAELCGKGHFSMKKIVRIVEQDEYEEWFAAQQPYYLSTIRNSNEDPYAGQLLNIEIENRKTSFFETFDEKLIDTTLDEKLMRLEYIYFETDSDQLTGESIHELSNIIEALNVHPELSLELAGHTDNTGDASANLRLSQQRADAVKKYIVNQGINNTRLRAVGYGHNRPIISNDTAEGRTENRRTELKILTR